MPPFQPPRPPFRSSQLRAWSNTVEPEMRNLLWGDYWHRFNTVQIPILGEDDYFKNAVEVAKLAKGQKAEFERMFEERNRKRQDKLISQMAKAANQTIYKDDIFPCKDALIAVSEVCLSGCLTHFLRLLNGTAYGWEADAADVCLNNAAGNLSEEMQNSPIDQGADFESQLLDDSYYETPMERQMREEESANATYYIGTYTTHYSDNLGSNVSVLEKEEKAPAISKKRKRDQSNDENAPQELKTPSSILSTSIQQVTDDNCARDVHKRPRIASPLAPEPTSINTHPAAANGVMKRRSRHDDCGDGEHGRKRQKIKGRITYSPPDTSIQQISDDRAATKESKPQDGGQRRGSRKRKKLPPKPSRGSVNTRSTRKLG
ncbi:hypothetical protein V8C35DRAFT_316361 [Trichoderma chlorosporum]